MIEVDEKERAAIRAHCLLLKEAGAKLFIHKALAARLKALGLWDDEVHVVVAPIPVSVS